jgi:hypothetical protein
VRVVIHFIGHTLSAVFSYDFSSTAGKLVERIKAKYPAENFKDYGLLYAFTVWMEEHKFLVKDYEFEGEAMVEYLPNPWILTVEYIDAAPFVGFLNPDETVAEAVKKLMKYFNVPEEEDYGLYIIPKNDPTKGEYLQDTKKLSVHKDLKTTVS